MSQTSIERLREYLAQLPPQSQALLMREFERSLERGEDVTVANFVLGQLRQIVRNDDEQVTARAEDPARVLFRPLEPFLVEHNAAVRPGQIRRSSLPPIWQWLGRHGAVGAVREFETTLAGLRGGGTAAEVAQAARKIQTAAGEAIHAATAVIPGVDNQRNLLRIGSPMVIEDLRSVGAVLGNRDVLEALSGKLPGSIGAFGDSQVNSVMSTLNVPSLQTPQALPFTLSLVMSRLTSSWQVIRLAVHIASSDDEIKVAATPYGVAVTMALHDLSHQVSELRSQIKRGHFQSFAERLKIVHDGMRGVRTELDLRNDSVWGRQVAAIRVDISNSLGSEIESVPGRVRRLLRQRPDKDITATMKVDPTEVEEVVGLIGFVTVCRTYASELAINEVTLRTFSDLQQYIEKSTESLVQSLRGSDAKVKAFRQMQMKAAIRFCETLFGADYAATMRRAAENAMVAVERKSSRAS
jgi:hypothetical protein